LLRRTVAAGAIASRAGTMATPEMDRGRRGTTIDADRGPGNHARPPPAGAGVCNLARAEAA